MDAAALLNAAGMPVGANLRSMFCGRHLSGAAAGEQASRTICTKTTPFSLGVRFNDQEYTMAALMAHQNEQSDDATADAYAAAPLGTIGFQLSFDQINC